MTKDNAASSLKMAKNSSFRMRLIFGLAEIWTNNIVVIGAIITEKYSTKHQCLHEDWQFGAIYDIAASSLPISFEMPPRYCYRQCSSELTDLTWVCVARTRQHWMNSSCDSYRVALHTTHKMRRSKFCRKNLVSGKISLQAFVNWSPQLCDLILFTLDLFANGWTDYHKI